MRQSSRALAALLVTSALGSPAFAQLAPPAPVQQTIDKNAVDLFNGTLDVQGPVLSLGRGGAQGIQYYKISRNGGWTDNVTAGLDLEGTTMTATFGAFSDTFTQSGSTFTNNLGNGSTLTLSGSVYTYTLRDGTVVQFDSTQAAATPYYSNSGRPTTITTPTGAKLTFAYQKVQYCKATKPGGSGPICTQTGYIYRPITLTSSYGYQLSFSYDPNYDYVYDGSQPDIQPDFYHWSQSIGVTGTNLALASGASTPTQSWANTTVGTNTYFQVTDPIGRITQYRMSAYTVLGITLPGSSSEDETINYTSGRVTSVVTPAGTTTYSSSDVSGVRTVTVTDPLSHVTTYKFNITAQTLTSVTDPNSHTTASQYDSYGRITQITKPEGNYTTWTYDARGNITQVDQKAKSGSGLSDIITTANYDTTCTIPVKCNKPNWTKDALGNETDYTYDSTSGNVLTITQPAPTTGAVRPQVRFSYTSMQAYFKNSSGSIVASGQPVSLLTGTSTCQTTASCTGTSDEVKTSTNYGPQITGTGNNLLPVSVSKGDGTGALTATTSYTYDDVGNLTYVDGPLSGTADTTRTLYNADREVIGTISPDPDGSGPLPNRAVRNTVDSRGLVTKVEAGTTAGQTDTAWASFASTNEVDLSYDARRRVTTKQLSSGGTAYGLTQISYNADDSVSCVATRMNTAVYGSLPSSACTLSTQGSFGPDRINQTVYDAAGEVTLVQVGVGTTAAANERTLSYNPNGTLASLTDANNNVTSYTYDGFDRKTKTTYPGGSTEQVTLYDANGNEQTVLNRAGQSFSFTYDALNRKTAKSGAVPQISYTYDNLGRMLSATFASGGLGITNTYDALSRLTSTSSNMSGTAQTLSYQYDLAGDRTQLTYADGHYLNYDHLVTGEVTAVRLNGATSGVGVIGSYAYDQLGNRSSLTNGDGSSTSYTYDPVNRLATLQLNFAASANNLTKTFAYSPASAITSVTSSNDAYAWNGAANVNRSYTPNGLNQYANVGGASYNYDPNGNLTSDGTNSFVYDAENHMTSATVNGVATTLSYDPLGRLWRLQSGSTDTRYVSDGGKIVVVYNGATVANNIMYGPGTDEPIAGVVTGSTPTGWWHADERGSIVARTDASGNVNLIQSYDEYGIPGTSNGTFFQYTGQAYLSQLGMYYYKARMYSTTLGRFMQTDPIGTNGGINLYNYTGNDPVNATDPAGTDPTACQFSGAPTAQQEAGCRAAMTAQWSAYHGEGDFDGNMMAGLADASAANFLTSATWNGDARVYYGQSDPNYAPGNTIVDQVNNREADSRLGALGLGASSTGWTGPGYVCIDVGLCQSRGLTQLEKIFYGAFGLPASVLDGATLIKGLPIGPYLSGGINGYTMNNNVFLLYGIGNYLADPYWAGLLGHELYHVWQYQQGATFGEFGAAQVMFGHDNSPLEVPAINFGRSICRTGGGGNGCDE